MSITSHTQEYNYSCLEYTYFELWHSLDSSMYTAQNKISITYLGCCILFSVHLFLMYLAHKWKGHIFKHKKNKKQNKITRSPFLLSQIYNRGKNKKVTASLSKRKKEREHNNVSYHPWHGWQLDTAVTCFW